MDSSDKHLVKMPLPELREYIYEQQGAVFSMTVSEKLLMTPSIVFYCEMQLLEMEKRMTALIKDRTKREYMYTRNYLIVKERIDLVKILMGHTIRAGVNARGLATLKGCEIVNHNNPKI